MIRVNYKGLIADICGENLKEGIAFLSTESTNSRTQILQSVDNALERVLVMVGKGETISPQLMQNTANDIGIWFANEVLEGRAERYRASIQ